jgi:hypothetical protein
MVSRFGVNPVLLALLSDVCEARAMLLYAIILSMCSALVPSSNPVFRHGRLATAITTVLERRGPLFSDDADRRKTAALLVAVAYRESTLDVSAIGDKGHSFCAFQIHDSNGGSDVLCDSAESCVERAYDSLKVSFRYDPQHPIAFYARGPKGFASLEAQRISNDRMMLAKKLATIPF